jgi:hypothetical protein
MVDNAAFAQSLLALLDGGKELLLVSDVGAQGFVDEP